MVGGPWGAVAGATASAIVLGFRHGAAQAAKDAKTLAEIKGFGENAAKAIAAGANPILIGLQTQSDIAGKGLPTDLAAIDQRIRELRKRRDELKEAGGLASLPRAQEAELKQLEAARVALVGGRVDSLQYDAALRALAKSGTEAGKAAQTVRDRAGEVDSDSPSRLAGRFSDLVDQARHASDSLRVQERDMGRVKTASGEARDSLHALEVQMNRLKPKHVGVTIDILQRYRTSGKPGSKDPEVRTSVARITAANDYSANDYHQAEAAGFAGGGLLDGPGTGTSDSMWIRASNGEFVVNAAATAKHLALLTAINRDSIRPAAYTYGNPHPAASGGAGSIAGPVVHLKNEIYGSDNIIRDAANHTAREISLALADA
jgi:hypothetical protein